MAALFIGSRRFIGLFLFTVGVFIVQAAMPDLPFARQTISLAFFYAIWVTLAASGAHAGLRVLLFGVWACTALLRWLPIPGLEVPSMVAARMLGAALLVICLGGIVRYVLLTSRITVDTLFAAAVIYILLAAAFGQAFAAFHLAIPQAFVAAPHLHALLVGNPDHLFNYFSFVTLATLGYGDVVPVHPVVQVLAMLETVLGQLYVAVIVAWLVGHVVIERGRARPES